MTLEVQQGASEQGGLRFWKLE